MVLVCHLSTFNNITHGFQLYIVWFKQYHHQIVSSEVTDLYLFTELFHKDYPEFLPYSAKYISVIPKVTAVYFDD